MQSLLQHYRQRQCRAAPQRIKQILLDDVAQLFKLHWVCIVLSALCRHLIDILSRGSANRSASGGDL